MKIRGRSDLIVYPATSLERVAKDAEAAVQDFVGSHPNVVLHASSSPRALDGEGIEIELDVVIRAATFAEAESVVDHLRSHLTAALTAHPDGLRAPEGATQLVPA